MFPATVTIFLALAVGQALAPPPSSEVRYGPEPAWALRAPAATSLSAPEGAAARFIYSDSQIRIGPKGTEFFLAHRLKVLKPEGLAVGNIALAWNPAAGDVTIHRLALWRGGQVTDVLTSTKFQVLQREGGLEQAVLSGQLTASIQTPGLQVGDELEFAATIRQQDPTLPYAFGFAQLPIVGMSGAFRVRIIWPETRKVRWKATKDLSHVTVGTSGDMSEWIHETTDPKSAILTERAPSRLNRFRQIEFSEYDSWAELSRQEWLLYHKASTLDAASPLREEVARIAAATSDPAERTLAALKLVQEQVRYVYVGLDGGNIRPASADETWQRRFGDCKGKSALLLALLRELGVPAEAALVNVEDDDGMDERLPSPGWFNHLVVQARIGPNSYWLDGTRLGDGALDSVRPLTFKWALPLRPKEAGLISVPLEAPKDPQLIEVVHIDASAGFDHPAKVRVQQVLRGDDASKFRAALSGMQSDDAERALKGLWRRNVDWVEPDTVAWRFEDKFAALVLTMSGDGKPDWEGDHAKGRSLTIVGAGFFPPEELKRPREQDQAAPWKTDFPRFRCWATAIRLPASPDGWTWRYRASAMDRRLGGRALWRTADLRDNVIRTVMSSRYFQPEISPEEAAEQNAAIPGFDNAMSMVFQARASEAGSVPANGPAPPFDDDTNWLESSTRCLSPSRN
jgi:hypothetical protein